MSTDEEKYYKYVAEQIEKCINYNDYLIGSSIKVDRYFKSKINELYDATRSNTIGTLDIKDLDEMILFQEFIASKLDKLMNSFNKTDFHDFVDAFKNEEALVAEYKRNFKLESIIDGDKA
jgi:hypothetical protein